MHRHQPDLYFAKPPTETPAQASIIENAIRSKSPTQLIDDHMIELREILSALRSAIIALPDRAERNVLATTIDHERVCELIRMLENGDLSALSSYREIQDTIRALISLENFKAISMALDELDLRTAANLLKSVQGEFK